MAIKKARLTPQDIEEIIACGYPLAQIARESGVDRVTLSKFRNHGQALKAADHAALIAWLRENDLWEDDGAATPAKPAKAEPAPAPATQVFPLPSIAVPVRAVLPAAEQTAVMRLLDAQVRENDRLLALEVEMDEGFLYVEPEPTGASIRANEELRQGLAVEAVLRRVLDGSFTARHSEAKPATQADLIAGAFLGALATDPPTPANSPGGLAAARDDAAGEAGNPESEPEKRDGLPGPFAFLSEKKAA